MNSESAASHDASPITAAIPLNVLQVEDSESDAAMAIRLLRKSGYEVSARRVEDEPGMRAALEEQAWDVILADYNLPQFSAPRALEILHEKQLDTPFLVVSGVIGEEAAVSMMKSGAHDYVLKNNLTRLGPAVEREIREARMRQERRQQEQYRIQMGRELEIRNHALRKAFAELEAAMAEKTLLLKEIHHRVKNNLAVVCSLLSMKAGASESREVQEALEESQQRVRSIALVHEFLYASDNMDRINFSDFVERVVQELASVFTKEPGRPTVRVEAEPVEVEITQAIPCGLILNELVTNAFKYAFPEGKTGQLVVSFRDVGSGYFELSVEDNGIGCTADAMATKPASLGMTIMHTLTQQLCGTLTQEPARGTRFVLRFPVRASRNKVPEPPPRERAKERPAIPVT